MRGRWMNCLSRFLRREGPGRWSSRHVTLRTVIRRVCGSGLALRWQLLLRCHPHVAQLDPDCLATEGARDLASQGTKLLVYMWIVEPEDENDGQNVVLTVLTQP